MKQSDRRGEKARPVPLREAFGGRGAFARNSRALAPPTPSLNGTGRTLFLARNVRDDGWDHTIWTGFRSGRTCITTKRHAQCEIDVQPRGGGQNDKIDGKLCAWCERYALARADHGRSARSGRRAAWRCSGLGVVSPGRTLELERISYPGRSRGRGTAGARATAGRPHRHLVAEQRRMVAHHVRCREGGIDPGEFSTQPIASPRSNIA